MTKIALARPPPSQSTIAKRAIEGHAETRFPRIIIVAVGLLILTFARAPGIGALGLADHLAQKFVERDLLGVRKVFE